MRMWKPWKRKTAPGPAPLDYDALVHLDAEDLAEEGIGTAYAELLPRLREYLSQPAGVVEVTDPDLPAYKVRCAGTEYLIYAGEVPGSEDDSWGNATWALFDLVNRQLENAPVRLYAINGGNDLGGMLLTPGQAEGARASLPRKADWPYLPEREGPWFGMPHDPD